eukprot:6616563-Pyramimonas_sp.AAC.1
MTARPGAERGSDDGPPRRGNVREVARSPCCAASPNSNDATAIDILAQLELSGDDFPTGEIADVKL